MLKFVKFFVFIASVIANTIPDSDALDGRIIGGLATTINSFPYQVSLQKFGRHICGGAIYSDTFILTAAHCLQNVYVDSLRIRAGSSFWSTGGILIRVADFKYHINYNTLTQANDIAIIKLALRLPLGSTIRPINLAITPPANGANAIVSGWGVTNFKSKVAATQLHYAQVSIISRTQCRSLDYGYGSIIKNGMICACALGKDACQGDSGGPLVSGDVLVGIVSWGYQCGLDEFPGIYTDVALFRNWIENQASSFSED